MKKFSQTVKKSLNPRISYIEVTKDDIRDWLSNNHRFAEMVRQIPAESLPQYIDQNHNSQEMVSLYQDYLNQRKQLHKDNDVNVSYNDFIDMMKLTKPHAAVQAQMTQNSVESLNNLIQLVDPVLQNLKASLDSVNNLIQASSNMAYNTQNNSEAGKIMQSSMESLKSIAEVIDGSINELNTAKSSNVINGEYLQALAQALASSKNFIYGFKSTAESLLKINKKKMTPKPPGEGYGSMSSTSIKLSNYKP